MGGVLSPTEPRLPPVDMSVPGRRCQVSRVATHTDLASFDAGQGTTGTNTAMPRHGRLQYGVEGTKKRGRSTGEQAMQHWRQGWRKRAPYKDTRLFPSPDGYVPCQSIRPAGLYLYLLFWIECSCIVPSGQGAMWMGGRVAVSGMLHMYGLSEAVADSYCHAGAASAG